MIQELNEFVVEKLLWWLLAQISTFRLLYVQNTICIDGSRARLNRKEPIKYYCGEEFF